MINIIGEILSIKEDYFDVKFILPDGEPYKIKYLKDAFPKKLKNPKVGKKFQVVEKNKHGIRYLHLRWLKQKIKTAR